MRVYREGNFLRSDEGHSFFFPLPATEEALKGGRGSAEFYRLAVRVGEVEIEALAAQAAAKAEAGLRRLADKLSRCAIVGSGYNGRPWSPVLQPVDISIDWLNMARVARDHLQAQAQTETRDGAPE